MIFWERLSWDELSWERLSNNQIDLLEERMLFLDKQHLIKWEFLDENPPNFTLKGFRI